MFTYVNGPVAQRLEQGTHGQAFLRGFSLLRTVIFHETKTAALIPFLLHRFAQFSAKSCADRRRRPWYDEYTAP
jgi:hypothetical protein